MKRTKNTYIIIAAAMLAAALLLPAACKVEVPAVPEEEEESPVTLGDINLTFGTKEGSGGSGSYTDTTFRVSLYDASTYYYSGLSGTYCLPNPLKGSPWLTPCKVVDSTGAYDSTVADPEATIYGLQARNGTYFMSISSPAVEMKSPQNKKGIYGFYYDRERTPEEKVLYVSDSIRAVITGVCTDSRWLYVVDKDIRLKERRSRLKLSVSCGKDIESAVIRSVRLANVLNRGYYLPSTMEFDYESGYLEDVTVKDYGPGITLYGNPGAGQQKTDSCGVQPFVLSMDYSKVDKNKKPVHPLPEIDVVIGSDGGKTAKIPLAFNFLPENIYDCHVTINSSDVRLYLSVLDWDKYGDSGESGSYLKQSLTVTVKLWDSGISGTDGDTEIHDEEW